jgi:hypothetical protein
VLDWVNESAFRQAVEVAQRHCNEFRLPPPLDYVELDSLSILFLWDDSTDEAAIDELVSLCEPHDPVTRSVVAATLYRNSGKKTTDDDAARQALATLARAEDVEWIESVERLRWELHLAVAARCLDRALALVRRLEHHNPTPTLRSVAATELFLAVHPLWGSVDVDGANLLDPLIGHLDQDPNGRLCRDLRCYQLATSVGDERSSPWRDVRALSASAHEALVEIDIWLTRALQASGALTPAERAVQIWSHFCLAVGKADDRGLGRVGEDYLNLPWFCIGDTAVADSLEAATVTLAAAGRWSMAATAAAGWAQGHPHDRRAHKYRAKALYKQDESNPQLLEALEDHERALPDSDDEWEVSLLWHWGSELKRLRATQYERAADAAPERPFGQCLQTWLWPRFDSLSEDAKERWWTALYVLASPQNAANIPGTLWKVAASNFGEAIANELKIRIFVPFAATKPSLSDLDEKEARVWKNVMRGRGTLGQLITCLREPYEARTVEVRERLKKWLDECHPKLPNYIRTSPRSLSGIADLRIEGAHDTMRVEEQPGDGNPLNAADVLALYKLGTALLDKVEANEKADA